MKKTVSHIAFLFAVLLACLECASLANLFSCASLSAPAVLPSCQSQPQTEAERKKNPVKYDVRVAVDVCTEDRDHIIGSGEYATLNCQGDDGVYRIALPRKEWLDMKRDGTGLTNVGPGK